LGIVFSLAAGKLAHAHDWSGLVGLCAFFSAAALASTTAFLYLDMKEKLKMEDPVSSHGISTEVTDKTLRPSHILQKTVAGRAYAVIDPGY
jgi:hypothetical protein